MYLSRTSPPLAHLGDFSPRLIRETEFLFVDLIQRCRRKLIMEGQYYWSKIVHRTLTAKLRQRCEPPLEVTLILADSSRLTGAPKRMELEQGQMIGELFEAASQGSARLTIATPWVVPVGRPDGESAPSPRPVYVHSKLIVVDDEYVSIGSANFADRALRVDTELTLTLQAVTPAERARIRALSERVVRHWSARDGDQALVLRPLDSGRTTDAKAFRACLRRLTDPSLPWSHVLTHRRKTRTLYATLLWATGAALIASSLPPAAWPVTLLLYSNWLVRMPFLPLCMLGGVTMGRETGPSGTVVAFWLFAISGYVWARSFPNAASRSFPPGTYERLGRRRFESVVSLLLDPRLSFRNKVLSQGSYRVPFVWFFWGTLTGLGSLVYMITWYAARWA